MTSEFDCDGFICTSNMHNARDGCDDPNCFNFPTPRPEWEAWLAKMDALIMPILHELDAEESK